MILHALKSYYDRLAADPNSDVAPLGFSRQQISFCVILNENGTLHEIVAENNGDSKNPRPKSMTVFGGAKPSGSGINPGFLWDNSGYMLGYKPDDEKPERTLKTFEAFRERHLELSDEIEDPEYQAVCRFLERWDPKSATDHSVLVETKTGFGVFRLRDATHYVHEREAILHWWNARQSESDGGALMGQCLLSGHETVLARVHKPKIKGVSGAQSAGAAIVSFNEDAYESFGKYQSYNAPVGEIAAFQYCTALNHLLRSRDRRVQIGDATTVFWTEAPSPMEDLFGIVTDPTSIPVEDEAQRDSIYKLLRRIASGEYPTEIGDPETRFYVLGLSPNAARLSVRFWYSNTLQELVDALQRHFDDLAIVRSSERDPEFPAVWQLLRETARESKDIPPLISGSLMRAILTGTPYPQILYSSVIRRIRADREVRYVRAAIIKAYIQRNSRLGNSILSKEISMSLDPDRPEPAYQMGRLFAELEKTQEDALPGINDTVKDRYFGAISATPGGVFPRLIRLSQHHLGKLEKNVRVYHERRIQEICGRFDVFPAHLNMEEQGLFALGYYHQRQAIFTKKEKPAETEAVASEA